MDNICDLCIYKSKCKNQLVPCNYTPKYNLCPICKERTVVYEPRCYKCGYEFKVEMEAKV